MSRPQGEGHADELAARLTSAEARIHELEELCSEVYAAAVEIGLPQALLNRIWTVAAHGRAPLMGYAEPAPDQSAQAARARKELPAAPFVQLPVPHVPIIHRPDAVLPGSENRPQLKPLDQRRTVLVVDDDPLMLALIQSILSRENYELLLADSGETALARLDEHPVQLDALVVDYQMPGMKGPEVAERLLARQPGLPVLFQTGFSDLLFHDRLELGERQAFLEKPFSARGLVEALRFLLFGSLNPPPA
ncbi:MAG: response regulator [Vicinamibacterales bacterium]